METGEFTVAQGTLRYRAWPAARGGKVLVQLHGIESHSGWFAAIGEGLAARGVTTYSPDRVGSGRSDGHRGHVESAASWCDHLRAFIDWVRREHRPSSLHLVGSCWGGKLALFHTLAEPEAVDSLILLSAGLRVRVGLPLRSKLRIAWALRNDGRRPFPIPIPRDEMFTRLPEALAYIRNDPLRLHHVTARFLYEMRKMDRANRKNVGQLAVPVLALFSEGDEIVDVPRAISMLRQARSSILRIMVLRDVHHCMEFGTGDLVAGKIADWLGTTFGANGELHLTDEEKGTPCPSWRASEH